jgi:hypothetical protein
MASLNVFWPSKTSNRLLTAAVFQSTMLPYVTVAVVGLVSQLVTAEPRKLLSVSGVGKVENALTPGAHLRDSTARRMAQRVGIRQELHEERKSTAEMSDARPVIAATRCDSGAG